MLSFALARPDISSRHRIAAKPRIVGVSLIGLIASLAPLWMEARWGLISVSACPDGGRSADVLSRSRAGLGKVGDPGEPPAAPLEPAFHRNGSARPGRDPCGFPSRHRGV